MPFRAEETLRPEELVTLALRGLFSRLGYRKYTMAKFEEYELYLDNRDFLKSREILTFTDMDGRMLALRPDVTLSIAKNTRASARRTEKLYYLENVYRLDKPSGAFREIPQLGLECIGKLDAYLLGEVVALALESLRAISPACRMQLSHIGFPLALLDACRPDAALRPALLQCIRQKNGHELRRTALRAGIAPEAIEPLAETALLSGPFRETLGRAEALCVSPRMREALSQLKAVARVLEPGDLDAIALDFSLVSDNDYYSGLMMQGFVEGLPRPVLAGGEYGNLLRKFRKPVDAIGFAVYLGELTRFYPAPEGERADALVLYDEGADPAALLRQARALAAQGKSVRVERAAPQGLSFGQCLRFAAGEPGEGAC